MNPDIERKLEAWVPAVVYTGFIFAVSSIPGLTIPFGDLKLFDKLAHATEFTGLGLFLFVAFRGSLPTQRRRHAFLFAVAFGLLIGVGDELYQLTVPGRALEFRDWVADSVGVLLGSSIAKAHSVIATRGRPSWAARGTRG